MTSLEKTNLLTEFADEQKAERIEVVDVRAKTSVADYFVICSALNDRHIVAIAEKVAEKFTPLKEKPLRTEGERTGWVLLDFGDVIFHVMKEEQRQFFDLESFWATMKPNPDVN